MTGSEAYVLVYGAKSWLSRHAAVRNIDLDTASAIGDAATHVSANGVEVRVGVFDIVSSPDTQFRDGEALLPFVALFHEVAGHTMQLTHEFSKTNTLSKVLFLDQCACKGSAQYYGIDDAGIPHDLYFSHPHEIAAQYMGIKCGYECLHSICPNDADRMMLDYIAYRRESSGEFLPAGAKFDTVKGALKEMNKEFHRRIETHREFAPAHDSNDALGKVADRSKSFPVLDTVKNCRNGLRQDGMMACAFLETMADTMPDDTAFLRATRVHRDLGLDIRKMFTGTGCPIWPPPIRPLTNLERLRSITDEMDARETAKQPENNFEKQ